MEEKNKKINLRLAYYPGCSLHGTAKEYDASTRAVCKELGIELQEVPDWNCCGASSAHSVDKELAISLPARNLKIIENQKLDVVIPCAACFSRTKACSTTLTDDTSMREKIEKEMDYSFNLNTKIYHLMELFAETIGLDAIKSHVKHYFNGLRVVCYYGCLLVRPHGITKLDDKENPQFLDQLMNSIGATSVDWPYKTECCGASLSLTKGDLVTKIVNKMICWAEEADVQAIVTACPLCQANLEMRQGKGKALPVFYFTELLGLSFGIKEIRSSLKEHLISTETLVDNLTKKHGQ